MPTPEDEDRLAIVPIGLATIANMHIPTLPEYSSFFIHIVGPVNQQIEPDHSKKGKAPIETERQGELPRLWLFAL